MDTRSRIDIIHLAWLARIRVNRDEEELFSKRIEAALRIIDKLLSARIDDIEPLYHPQEHSGRLRPDRVEECRVQREKILANAASVEKGFIVAPRTVED